jgi:hypothetical protein
VRRPPDVTLEERVAAPWIEGFELGARIGSGALGTVYVARKAPREERAAAKIFDQAHVSRRQSTVLLNEAVAASSIRQASTADIVDLGELPNGRPYLVMEPPGGGVSRAGHPGRGDGIALTGPA